MQYINNWFVKYLVIFSFIAAILYGVYYYYYPNPYERFYYTHNSTTSGDHFFKIDKVTGEVYRFNTNLSGRNWQLLNP